VYKTILATTVPHNTSSVKLLTKLGLHFEKEIEVDNMILHVYSN
jgi:[ribosomal protein S5]-alanine N-acetyltransferase